MAYGLLEPLDQAKARADDTLHSLLVSIRS